MQRKEEWFKSNYRITNGVDYLVTLVTIQTTSAHRWSKQVKENMACGEFFWSPFNDFLLLGRGIHMSAPRESKYYVSMSNVQILSLARVCTLEDALLVKNLFNFPEHDTFHSLKWYDFHSFFRNVYLIHWSYTIDIWCFLTWCPIS